MTGPQLIQEKSQEIFIFVHWSLNRFWRFPNHFSAKTVYKILWEFFWESLWINSKILAVHRVEKRQNLCQNESLKSKIAPKFGEHILSIKFKTLLTHKNVSDVRRCGRGQRFFRYKFFFCKLKENFMFKLILKIC